MIPAFGCHSNLIPMKYASKLSHTSKSWKMEEAAVSCRELQMQREIILRARPDLLSLFPLQSLPSLL